MSWSLKSNHFCPPLNNVSARLVKIQPLVQDIECRQEAMLMSTGSVMYIITAIVSGDQFFSDFYSMPHLVWPVSSV